MLFLYDYYHRYNFSPRLENSFNAHKTEQKPIKNNSSFSTEQ